MDNMLTAVCVSDIHGGYPSRLGSLPGSDPSPCGCGLQYRWSVWLSYRTCSHWRRVQFRDAGLEVCRQKVARRPLDRVSGWLLDVHRMDGSDLLDSRVRSLKKWQSWPEEGLSSPNGEKRIGRWIKIFRGGARWRRGDSCKKRDEIPAPAGNKNVDLIQSLPQPSPTIQSPISCIVNLALAHI